MVNRAWVTPSLLVLALAAGGLAEVRRERQGARLEAQLARLADALTLKAEPGGAAVERRPSPDATPAPHRANELAALAGARSRVSRALESGRITPDELRELHVQLMTAHDPPAVQELLRQLGDAMNSGRIQPPSR